MANDVTSNPWILDTAAATVLTRDALKIKTLRWVGATTAGHTISVTNAAGKVVWASVAPAANYVEESLFENIPPIMGLVLPTMSSGKLYVEFA